MTVTVYDFSVPALMRGLNNLSTILDKAAAHAVAKKFDPAVLLQSRLFPDMHPLIRQVQITCDTAMDAAARLAGVEVPKHEDAETTIEELQQQVVNTLDYLKKFQLKRLSGADDRLIQIKSPSGAWKFTAVAYLAEVVLPNFYFHLSMVYALLRNNGVELGKSDYLGSLQ